MSYFVTGATGFVGRFLVERLLEREGDIHVLVREGSREKLDALIERWGAADRIKPVQGDLAEPMLGVSEADRKALEGVEHVFHLAAIYDMTADETRNALLNVGGTQNAVQLANEVGAGVFHHISSVAVAGRYKGHFTEDMFDEGQELHTPYHRTKFEAEKHVREKVQGAWRVYRPAVVVGSSKTGEMDKVDGPYYFFKVLQKLRTALPQWAPLVSVEWGWTNLVPVDYVAAAIDHIAHEEGLDGQAFHIVDPKGIRSGDAMNTFARAGHAPHAVMRVDKKLTSMLPEGRAGLRDADPGPQGRAQVGARRPRDPRRDPRRRRASRRSSTRATPSARSPARASSCRSWTPTPTSCGTTGSATWTRTCSRTAPSRARSTAAPWSSPAPRAASAAPRR